MIFNKLIITIKLHSLSKTYPKKSLKISLILINCLFLKQKGEIEIEIEESEIREVDVKKSITTVPGDKTICFPVVDDKEYIKLVKNTKVFRKYLVEKGLYLRQFGVPYETIACVITSPNLMPNILLFLILSTRPRMRAIAYKPTRELSLLLASTRDVPTRARK
jgi:hypothetical protein